MKIFSEDSDKRYIAAIVAIGLLVILAYSNSFQAGWHMDDYPNILNNPDVQATDLGLESLQRATGISRSRGNSLPRPVTNLTFALNWWAHGTNVAGYHLVNIAVHIFCTWLLFLIVDRLSASPVVSGVVRRNRTAIALVTALLWALHPIQTQAVTYVVQRYTSLTALLYLAALYCYIRGRLARRKKYARVWWGLTLGSFFLALGAKENAVIWPASALLVEFVFFRDAKGALSPNFAAIVVAITALSIVFAGGLLITYKINIMQVVTDGFDDRPFSLLERLMTQPRVLLFYISQIFYPIPQRLSLEHDFSVSVDLLDPVTTLPAMVVVVILVVGALVSARRKPLLALAILFFFLNHAVESSCLPIEMVFEHRNYLPSVFVFWPLVAGGFQLQEGLHQRQSSLRPGLPALAAGIVLIMLLGTFTRNMDWRTERSLWVDTYRKAPQSARAAVNLANDLARAGHFDQAADLYTKALQLYSPKKNQFKVVAHSNLATMYFNTGQYDQAAHEWGQVLAFTPGNRPARQSLATLYMETGAFDKAAKQVDWLLKRHPKVVSFLNLKTFLLIKQNQPEKALAVSRRSLRQNLYQRDALLYTGVGHARLGDHVKADWFYRRAALIAPRDLAIHLCRLENSLEKRNADAAAALTKLILGRFPLETTLALLGNAVNVIRDPDRLRVALLQQIDHKAQKLEKNLNKAS